MTRHRGATSTRWGTAAVAGVGVLALLAVGCGDDTAPDGAAPAGDGGQASAERPDGASGSGSLVVDGESYELTSFSCGTVEGDRYWRGSGGPRLSTEIRVFEGSDYERYTVSVMLPPEGQGVAEAERWETWEGDVSTEANDGAAEVDVSGDRIEARLDLTQTHVGPPLESVADGPTASAEIDLTCVGD